MHYSCIHSGLNYDASKKDGCDVFGDCDKPGGMVWGGGGAGAILTRASMAALASKVCIIAACVLLNSSMTCMHNVSHCA